MFLIFTQQGQAQTTNGNVANIDPANLDLLSRLDKSPECGEDVKKFCPGDSSARKTKDCYVDFHLNENLSATCKTYLSDKLGLRKPSAPARKTKAGKATN